MSNKYLKKVQKKLTNYFSYFKSPNILVISEDKSVLPFAYLISDEPSHPDNLLLSLAVDYPYSEKAVEIALLGNSVLPIILSEQFFISQIGNTFVGAEAHKHYEIETEIPLADIHPLDDIRH